MVNRLNINKEVEFFPTKHSYILNGIFELSGVTSMLSRQMFEGMYANVPKKVMELSAERGSRIHEDIALFDAIGETYMMTPETTSYKQIKESMGFQTLANEYLVSNNVTHASQVDVVFEDKMGGIAIADIKTTSKIHEAYLRWQLSIYAYLFEMQNPHLKVDKLYCIWLPKKEYGEHQIKEVSRICDDDIIKLLECDARGEKYTGDLHFEIEKESQSSNVPSTFIEAEHKLTSILRKIEESKEIAERIKDSMKKMMEENGIKKYSSENIDITYVGETVRKSIDQGRLKEELPEVYAKYLKETNVKPSVRFNLK